MEIIRHLGNQQLIDLVCESDQQGAAGDVRGPARTGRAATERPEELWQKQRRLCGRVSLLHNTGHGTTWSAGCRRGMVSPGGDGFAGRMDGEPARDLAPANPGRSRS